MSHLTPVPRTDKLGRTMIRHMREPQSASVIGAKAIPSISLAKLPRDSGARAIELTESLHHLDNPLKKVPTAEKCQRFFRWLDSEQPEVSDIVERLFSSGTRTGRLLASQALLNTVDEVNSNGYDVMVGRANGMKLEMLELWNAGNLAEDVDCAQGFDFIKPSPIDLDLETRESFSDTDWRGFAALRLALDETSGRGVATNNPVPFIKWVMQQEDIELAISVAKERRTMNPEMIEAIIAESGETKSLREGAL